ncbi:hypothetical protein G6F56_009862 [Rhizopus delemar]|nr:hypothetical protein G6F56_009862 [Rhizopus delemar]
MKTHFIIFLAFITYVISAQGSYTPFYITNPVQNTTFEAGTNVTISWLNGTTDTAMTYVLTGEKSTAMQLTGISFNLKGKSGQYIWKSYKTKDTQRHPAIFQVLSRKSTRNILYWASLYHPTQLDPIDDQTRWSDERATKDHNAYNN